MDIKRVIPTTLGAVVKIAVGEINVAVPFFADGIGGRAVAVKEVHGIADGLVARCGA